MVRDQFQQLINTARKCQGSNENAAMLQVRVRCCQAILVLELGQLPSYSGAREHYKHFEILDEEINGIN